MSWNGIAATLAVASLSDRETIVCVARDQSYGIADPNRSAADHFGVERQFIVEAADDIAQYERVHLERVRIDRGHVAASAQGIKADDRLADMQFTAGPFTFGQPLDAFDDDVRSQPADIAAEGLNGTVGGDQQREYVETIEVAPCFEPGIPARGR